MLKKYRTRLLIAIIFFGGFSLSLYPYQWDQGIKAFTLNMTISEVETVLLQYNQNMIQPDTYSSVHIEQVENDNQVKTLYYNDRDMQISQINSSQLKIDLKKVFGYRIGYLPQMEGEMTFYHETHAANSNPQFFPNGLIYQYRFFPLTQIKKINSALSAFDLGFYDKRLFHILYEIEISIKEKDHLLERLSKTYKIVSQEPKQMVFNSLNGDTEVIVSLQTSDLIEDREIDSQTLDSVQKYRVEYFHIPLKKKYLNYLKQVSQKVEQKEKEWKFQALQDF